MPSLATLFGASLPLLLAAVVYQVGIPDSITALVPNLFVVNIIRNIFTTTYCYVSVQTLSSAIAGAECFSVSNGKFSRVFLDETSFDIVKESRVGHVIPGLWDGHGHLLQYGESLDSVDIFGSKSMEEVQERLVQYKAGHDQAGTNDQWLRGVGWDQANFGGKWPVASDLEIGDQFKDLYVMLDRVDVHCIWVSDAVLALLPTPLPDVPGGEIPARGVFCDNAMDIVLKYYPQPTKERKIKFIKDAMFELNKLGIVGMHDAGVFPHELKLYGELVEDDDWTVRINAMIECESRNTFCPDDAHKMETDNGKLQVKSVKLFGGEYARHTSLSTY
jgi:predicted amidohydrolase YtcJ